MKDPRICILAARRLPQGRFGGSLRGLGAAELGRLAVEGLLQDPALPRPGRVLWGMARSHGNGMNPARTIALRAGLPFSGSATTLNMACGSSLAGLHFAMALLEGSREEAVLVGGSEAMSDTPFLLPGLRWGYRTGHRRVPDVMHDDGLRCPLTGLLMGETIERLAAKRGVTRQDADAYAAESHRRAASTDLSAEFVPLEALDHDECIRASCPAAELALLPPVFTPDGQVTAGNASALSDGAAAILLSREGVHPEIRPLAWVRGWAEAGVDPMDMGEAPVPAVRRLLEEQGLGVGDVDLWELNEAFAAQVLVCQRQVGIPLERLNVGGGGISRGHPIGASGVRILVTLLTLLRARGGGLGVATLGIGGGLGQAVLVEVPA
ncbi:MAG: thiolase family protein [Acidobacteria bacterium]|nr:thiolase family protein [Acidobacteriota bacterium]